MFVARKLQEIMHVSRTLTHESPEMLFFSYFLISEMRQNEW